MQIYKIFIGFLILAVYLNESYALTSCYYGIGNSYSIINCASEETSYCQKRLKTYQVAMVEERYCSSACVQDAAGTYSGNYLIQTYCCQTDKCNLTYKLIHNKIVITSLVLLGLFLI